MPTTEPLRAACLTPPAAGGVAVIRAVGAGAAGLLAPYLRVRRPPDLETLGPRELRLCRLVDGDEVIDEAIVAVRRDDRGLQVIDLSLHGGPQIVQRALRLLAGAGAEIVEPASLRPWRDAADSAVVEAVLDLLPAARTPPAALWMLKTGKALAAALAEASRRMDAGDAAGAVEVIERLCRAAPAARLMVRGARVVLLGPPNAGKSTLANALADAGRAIVSDRPGTTRDWTEHAGSLDGVPCILVDTAGLREPSDALEAEAIRRAADQARRADLVLEVFDGSRAVSAAEMAVLAAGRPPDVPGLRVLNKSDLGCVAAWTCRPEYRNEPPVEVSALTGAGLADLRRRIREALGLEPPAQVVGPLTAGQCRRCRAIRDLLAASPPDLPRAREELASLLGGA